jgi:hypothetical protein
VIAVSVLCWSTRTRQARIAPHEERAVEEPDASEVITSSDLGVAVAQYREEQDYRKRCRIAKSFAASQTRFWDACVRRRMEQHWDERKALWHFADAYIKRGARQKEELISLLHSQDEELLGWLLLLLDEANELGPNGEWHPHKGLGGSELAHHIAGVYKTHPTLGLTIAQTLGNYGPAAKGEVRTLLRILLTPDTWTVFLAKIALDDIDPTVYAQFGLGSGSLREPLTDEQRTAIRKYLGSQ